MSITRDFSIFSKSTIDTIKGKVFKTFNWLYEHSPVNFATLTGWHHPSIQRLTGNVFLGTAGNIGLSDGKGVTKLINDLGALTEKDPLGRVYTNFATAPTILFSRPEDITQVYNYNSDKIDRGELLFVVKEQFGDHNIFTGPADAEWKKKRGALKEWIFAEKSLDHLAGDMQKIIDEYIAIKLKNRSTIPSAETFMVELTMDMVGRTVVGAQPLGDNAKSISDVFFILLQTASSPLNNFSAAIAKTKLGAIFAYFNYQLDAKLKQDRKLLETTLEDCFFEQNKNAEAFNSDKNIFYREMKEESDSKKAFHKVMDEIAVLLLAGHETTARLMQFTLLVLQKNPDIYKELQKEIDREKPADGKWTREHIQQMPYLGKVIKETLRLFPPFPVIVRQVTKDLVIGDIPLCKNKKEYDEAMAKRDVTKDIILHPGNSVFISPWITQRKEKYYEDALKFNPDRHASGIESFAPHSSDLADEEYEYFTLFPFGMGDRDCPGKKFALLEACMILANILEKFDFVATSNKSASGDLLDTYINGTLKVKEDVAVKFTRR